MCTAASDVEAESGSVVCGAGDGRSDIDILISGAG